MISRKITDLIVKDAKWLKHYTWIIIHEVPAENWMVDSTILPELKARLQTEKNSITTKFSFKTEVALREVREAKKACEAGI